MKKIYNTLQTSRAALMALMVGLFLMAAAAANAQTVTVTTDKDDYWPGEWVYISGTGWENDESVMLILSHLDPLPNPVHSHDTIIVIPDNGEISYYWLVLEQELGTKFQLEAVGMTTELKAITEFTDGSYVQSSLTSGQAPNPVDQGDFAIYKITYKGQKNATIPSDSARKKYSCKLDC